MPPSGGHPPSHPPLPALPPLTLTVAAAAAPRPADESSREESETVTLMSRAPTSARSMKYQEDKSDWPCSTSRFLASFSTTQWRGTGAGAGAGVGGEGRRWGVAGVVWARAGQRGESDAHK